MNYTENYQLCQWEASDPIRREDFNADNAAIDAALGALAAGQVRIASGSYTGTGTYGSANPTSLTLPFPANFILIWGAYGYLTLGAAGQNLRIQGGTSGNWMTTVWEEDGVSWYNSNAGHSQWQMNESGQTYCYIAIG